MRPTAGELRRVHPGDGRRRRRQADRQRVLRPGRQHVRRTRVATTTSGCSARRQPERGGRAAPVTGSCCAVRIAPVFKLRRAFVGGASGSRPSPHREEAGDFGGGRPDALGRFGTAVADGTSPRCASTPHARPARAPVPDSSSSSHEDEVEVVRRGPRTVRHDGEAGPRPSTGHHRPVLALQVCPPPATAAARGTNA